MKKRFQLTVVSHFFPRFFCERTFSLKTVVKLILPDLPSQNGSTYCERDLSYFNSYAKDCDSRHPDRSFISFTFFACAKKVTKKAQPILMRDIYSLDNSLAQTLRRQTYLI